MATIMESCRYCNQEVELKSADITLRVCNDAHLSYYSFICTECHAEVRRPADDHIISLLKANDVVANVWHIPAEALEPHVGPALNYDDLLDFFLQLGREDKLSARASACIHAKLWR